VPLERSRAHSKKEHSRVDKKQHGLRSSKHSERSQQQLEGRTSILSKKENEYKLFQESSARPQKQTFSTLELLKENKMKELADLEHRIVRLKQEEEQLFQVRGEWQSPTRPQTLRTAVSPRFRNDRDYTESF
jgi:hypothetical protein